ncbi:MAG: BatD family protein [Endomicrobium sp.]|nr:BatD family protein [Endomicrobium sp.]
MIKKIFCLAILSFAASSLYADVISFNASVDKKTVALNDSFIYSITVSGNGRNLPDHQIGNLFEFNRFGASTSQSMTIVNGKSNASVTYRYTLGPKKTGKFTIPPATITYNGKTYSTESIEIEVAPAKNIQSVSSAGSMQASVRRHLSQNPPGKAFVKASVNKTTVYENEKLVYKFNFYRNIDLISNPQYYPPDFTGFWNDGSKPKDRYEVIDGSNYRVDEVDTILYPAGAGVKTIAPTKLKITIMDFSGSDDDLFSVFSNMAGGRAKVLETNPIEIKVIALPQKGRPSDFTGAVGNFKIKASVDKQNAETNEPVTLTVTVSGDGNMKSVADIRFDDYSGFKKYDAIVANALDNSKEFKIIFIPQIPGDKQIPAASLSFFNPAKKRYDTIKTQPQIIVIRGESVYLSDSSSVESGVDATRSDINYNKPIKNLKQFKGHFVKKPSFYLIFAPFIILLLTIFAYKKIQTNPLRKNISSIAKIQKLLKNAEFEVSKNNLNLAVILIYQSLMEIITIKIGIVSDNLSGVQINEQLLNSGADKAYIAKIMEICDKLNFYKFASVSLDKESVKILIYNIKSLI